MSSEIQPAINRSTKEPADDIHPDGKTSQPLTPNVKSPPDGGWGWLCALGGFMLHFVAVAQLKAFGVLLPVLTEEYGTSNALTAWANGIANAAQLMLTPLATALCHRYSYRTVAIPGAIIAGVGMSLSYFATGLPFLYVTYGLMFGLGSSLVVIPSMSSTAEHFDRKSSIALGFCLLGTGVGTFIWPLILEYLLEEFSYQEAFLICGAITFNLLVAAGLFRNLNPKTSLDSSDVEIKISDVEISKGAVTQAVPGTVTKKPRNSILNKPILDKRILTDTSTILFCVIVFFVQIAYQSIFILLPTRGEEIADGDGFSAATLVAIIGLSETIFRLPLSSMWDISFLRQPSRRLVGITVFVFVMGVLVLLNPFMSNYKLLVINSAILGVATAGYMVTSFIVLLDLSGVDLYKDALALRLFASGLSGIIGPLITGGLLDITKDTALSFYFMGCSCMVCVVILCVLLYLRKIKSNDHAVVLVECEQHTHSGVYKFHAGNSVHEDDN
ncbi:PREDICTED: monocarboxylate transporter 12-like [Priapulus caudatus]|uniref:Monocarboxylate transporter 12-like n=1 Tax=Priapulus caudatus TaxID=37621 RepID=A0ABM1E3T8_PRICU|nr:PREDICTED: monocarboxylate transporter 12-like [Priapulus caudatus]